MPQKTVKSFSLAGSVLLPSDLKWSITICAPPAWSTALLPSSVKQRVKLRNKIKKARKSSKHNNNHKENKGLGLLVLL